MTERIILIDDDADLLRGLRRQLRKKYDVTTAIGGEAALELVKNEDTFVVAVSDMRMPGLSGLDVLKQIKKLSPDTQRIMLTGNLDQETAVNAVNQGSIFRFFSKPCPAEKLSEGIDAAIRQYQVITIEKDLLEKTLAGSVKVLTDVLAMAAPKAFRHSAKFRDWTRLVAKPLDVAQPWQLEIAAMLSPIGQVTLPAELAAKWEAEEPLNDEEQAIVDQLPSAGKRLVCNIPRMQDVADIVYYQDKGFDGSGFPDDGVSGADIPLGARVLKIFKGLNQISEAAKPSNEAFTQLAANADIYDPELLALIRKQLTAPTDAANSANVPMERMTVRIGQLRAGDVLETDVFDLNGSLLLVFGTKLFDTHIEKLHNLKRMQQLQRDIDSVSIARPMPEPAETEQEALSA